MSEKKHSGCKIVLSSGPRKRPINKFAFRYASFKVSLVIYEKGFAASYLQASFPRTIEFDQRKIEIIKKSLLLCLIEAGGCNDSYEVVLYVNGERKNQCKFYFLESLNDRLLSPKEKSELESVVLHSNRTNYPPSVVCYTNFALGGAKKASSAFRYLYQSLNSFYSNIEANSRTAKRLKTDFEKRQFIRESFFAEARVSIPKRNENNALCAKIDLTNRSSVIREINRRIDQEHYNFDHITDIDAFIVLCYSYYLRCNLFHGEMAFPIISSEGDAELKNINECNRVLGQFLRQHIGLLINQDYKLLTE